MEIYAQDEKMLKKHKSYGDSILLLGDNSSQLSGESVPQLSGNLRKDLALLGDRSHTPTIAQWVVPITAFATAAAFVDNHTLTTWRETVQDGLSQHGRNKTAIDNYIQYLPMVAGYGFDFVGVHSRHNFVDRTLLLAVGYSIFGLTNYTAKQLFKEQRPDTGARNSFPSGHTGTAVLGAEYLRREYWDTNRWLAISGYIVAAGVGYMRIYNDRHWVNDVFGGAALGYLSISAAYWLYPTLFRKRAEKHRDALLEQYVTTKHSNNISCVASPFIQQGTTGIAGTIVF
jgi:membrane-associated phospholipid phosphatase